MKQVFVFLLTTLISTFAIGQHKAFISGQITNFNKDTIKCIILKNGLTQQSQTIKIPVINNRFEIKIEIVKPTLITITEGDTYISGIIEPNDHINITYDANNLEQTLKYEGNAKEKFQLLNSLIQAKINNKIKSQVVIAKEKKYPYDHILDFIDSSENYYINKLKTIKNSFTKEGYELLEGEIKGFFIYKRYSSFSHINSESFLQIIQTKKELITAKTEKYLQEKLHFENIYSSSSTYIYNTFNILRDHYNENAHIVNPEGNLLKKYQIVTSFLPSKLKTQVLTLFIKGDLEKYKSKKDLVSAINSFYTIPNDNIYRKYIIEKYDQAFSTKNTLTKGIAAPDFLVQDIKGEKISLFNFKGKVLFMDFWFGACVPCHILFDILKPVKEYFKNNSNVVFLSVSVDDKKIWEKSLAKYEISGYHVFTQNKERGHTIIKDYKVEGYPTTYLIGKDGKIFDANPSNNADDLIKQIEAALKSN